MSVLTSLAPVSVIAYALNLLLHLTVICLVVLCASCWFFRRDPAARHTLCLTGLVCLLLAPVAVGMETKAGIGLITLALPNAASAKPAEVKGDLVLSPPEKPYRVAISAAIPAQPSIGWGGWGVLAAYMLGVGWGALRFAHGCRTASRLKQDVSPWKEPSDSVTLRTVEQALRAPIPPVFTSPHVASPIAIGLLHPAVILPDGLSETLSPQQLRHVLLHECAHVAFRHGLGGLLERIAGVLFWPHPLVRALCRELARAREEVCDNFASQEDGAPCYARTLLMVAQGIDIAPNLASTLALLGTGTSLEARISGLLDPRRNRMVSIKRWKLWAVTGTAIFAMGSTAAIRVVAAQEKAGQNPGGVLPGENAVTRVFAFQFMDANQAAEILYSSLPEQQMQQIDLAVDNRTNTLIVQSSGKQMIAIAALFGRLEAQAALERAQQEQASGVQNAAARIAKQQAEAAAQQAQAQKRLAEAKAQQSYATTGTVFSTQSVVQAHPVAVPKPVPQTRVASSAKFTQIAKRSSQTTTPKTTTNSSQRQLGREVQFTAPKAGFTTATGTTNKTSAPRKLFVYQAIDTANSLSQDKVLYAKTLKEATTVWKVQATKAASGQATTLHTDPQSLTRWSLSNLKSAKDATLKPFKVQFDLKSKPVTKYHLYLSGNVSDKTVLDTKLQADKTIVDFTTADKASPSPKSTQDVIKLKQEKLDTIKQELDKAVRTKIAQDKIDLRVEYTPLILRPADAAEVTKVLQAEYDRLDAVKLEQDAADKLVQEARARLAADAARNKGEKNPK